jgi:hypothetical protein
LVIENNKNVSIHFAAPLGVSAAADACEPSKTPWLRFCSAAKP